MDPAQPVGDFLVKKWLEPVIQAPAETKVVSIGSKLSLPKNQFEEAVYDRGELLLSEDWNRTVNSLVPEIIPKHGLRLPEVLRVVLTPKVGWHDCLLTLQFDKIFIVPKFTVQISFIHRGYSSTGVRK